MFQYPPLPACLGWGGVGSDAACLLLVAKDMVALNCTLQDMVAVDFWWDRAHGIPSGLFTCSGQRHSGLQWLNSTPGGTQHSTWYS